MKRKHEVSVFERVLNIALLGIFVFDLYIFGQFIVINNEMSDVTRMYVEKYNELDSLSQYNGCNIVSKIQANYIMSDGNNFNINFGRQVELVYFSNDTNSMSPSISPYSHAIAFIPNNDTEIHVCDVISYKLGNTNIFHRVISTGQDTNGTYYTVKGDNNVLPDPFKIRHDKITLVLLAVIY